jgi:hypothetical protein
LELDSVSNVGVSGFLENFNDVQGFPLFSDVFSQRITSDFTFDSEFLGHENNHLAVSTQSFDIRPGNDQPHIGTVVNLATIGMIEEWPQELGGSSETTELETSNTLEAATQQGPSSISDGLFCDVSGCGRGPFANEGTKR